MADKLLSEAAWTSFTKKQKLDLDDGPLVKALARFDKTDEKKPDARLDALKDIVEQAKKQVTLLAKKKKELGDKPFNEAKDKLYALLDAAETLQRDIPSQADADEEADSPALLTTKLVPLLRQLRAGDVTMSAMIGTAGRNTAVLIMRRPISPSRRTLLAEVLDAKGGAKYIVGEVMLEAKALTFVVKSQAAGLAKRIRQALLDQTGLRLKVRVRGEDGDSDEDGEDEAEATPTGGRPEVPEAPPLPSAAELAWRQRELKVKGPLEEALAARHPEATKLRALSGYASEKAEAGDFAGAMKALEMLEATLKAGVKPAAPETVDPAAAFKARLMALMPAIKKGAADGAAHAAEVKDLFARAGAAATKKDFEEAHRCLDAIEKLAGGPGTGGTPGDGTSTAAADVLADWQKARTDALASLRKVAADIAAEKHPESAAALLEINAVMKNLTESPTTLRQVTELENYLGEDDVVDEVCELADDFRTPLFKVLVRLRAAMTA